MAAAYAGISLDTEYIGRDVREFAQWTRRGAVIHYLDQRRHRPKETGGQRKSPSA
jgi:hypothetical protein